MRDGTLLPPVRPLPAGAAELRSQVRQFLSAERTAGRFVPACDAWLSGWDESFSRRLAERGWVGMTIPLEYGGHGRSALERYVVVEELLAAGAPVAAHWVSDRQIGPNLLRYGSERLKRRYLPAIAQGACYFAIGLSEPDARAGDSGSGDPGLGGAAVAVGQVVSRLWACRQMSLAVAGALAAGEAPEIAAALVKDVGTRLESEIIEVARMLTATLRVEPDPEGSGMAGLLAHAVLHAPGFTLRGGTNEILRGIVARGLALR